MVQGESARIRLGWPDLGEPELAEVAQVLETGMLTMGPKVAEFEELISAICEVAHARVCTSGTAMPSSSSTTSTVLPMRLSIG